MPSFKALTALLLLLAAGKALAAPIPEPAQDVLYLHAIAKDFLPADLVTRAVLMDDGGTPRGYANPNVAWLRDRYPLQAKDARGQPMVVPYLSLINASLGNALFDGSTYVPVQPPAGAPPGAHAFKFGDTYRWMAVKPLPLLLEGGDILPLSDWVLVSEKVWNENAQTPDELRARLGPDQEQAYRIVQQLVASGYRSRGDAEIREELSAAMGVPADHVVRMSWLPGERTGHVDMFAGALGEHTVLVPRIPASSIAALSYEHERFFATRTNQWLNEQVEMLERATRNTVQVVRVPMIPPKNLKMSSKSPLGWDAEFPTPANFVLHQHMAYVPHFPQWETELADRGKELQEEIRRVFAAAGYGVSLVNCSRLLDRNGLIHCLSAKLQCPR
jgi:hypothetical protein